jgi:hypothetical protein
MKKPKRPDISWAISYLPQFICMSDPTAAHLVAARQAQGLETQLSVNTKLQSTVIDFLEA